jgi:cell shape-determining protein MreC
MIRKEVLEDLVVDVTLKAFTKGTDLNTLAEQLLKKLNTQIHDQSILNLLETEQNELKKSLNNMLDAVEKGIITSSITSITAAAIDATVIRPLLNNAAIMADAVATTPVIMFGVT